MKAPTVAVVGGGIIGNYYLVSSYYLSLTTSGLSTALEVARLLPLAQVRIFSECVSPNTTADGAAGIFGLYLMGSTPVSDQVSRE